MHLDVTVAVIDFMFKIQKVKDSRIMDLWRVVSNILEADCDRLRLFVITHKWSWLGETAALQPHLSPALDICQTTPTPRRIHAC